MTAQPHKLLPGVKYEIVDDMATVRKLRRRGWKWVEIYEGGNPSKPYRHLIARGGGDAIVDLTRRVARMDTEARGAA